MVGASVFAEVPIGARFSWSRACSYLARVDRAVDVLLGDHSQFDVAALRVLDENAEGSVGVDVVGAHDDALGLFDDASRFECSLEVHCVLSGDVEALRAVQRVGRGHGEQLEQCHVGAGETSEVVAVEIEGSERAFPARQWHGQEADGATAFAALAN